MHDIIIDHNTIFNDPSTCGNSGLLYIATDNGAGYMTNFQLTNNIANYGSYGIDGDSNAPGIGALTAYALGYTYNHNVIMTTSGSSDGRTWPTGTAWNMLSGVGFTSYSGTNPNLTGNFQLLNSSPYHNAGTDGEDVGVWDWSVFNVKTTNARSGIFLP
jgi:hypothetical protein